MKVTCSLKTVGTTESLIKLKILLDKIPGLEKKKYSFCTRDWRHKILCRLTIKTSAHTCMLLLLFFK